jgi:diguanylate cyclase (GGDEF)-like protein
MTTAHLTPVQTTRGPNSSALPWTVHVVNDEKLSAVLSEFARTLITDFPIQAILDHLVKRIVEVLPVTSAGVTLISDSLSPRYLAASDEAALRFEKLQSSMGQGPCLSAYLTGEGVEVSDVAHDDRFPQFGPAAADAGLAAVFAFPLRHGRGRLGALDLYRDTCGVLDPDDVAAAQTLADVAAAYILNAQARDDARTASDRFLHDARHDPLTGLANRVLFDEQLCLSAERARAAGTYTAVVFADIDQFKRVNDTYGHHVGDELLIMVAKRLGALVRSRDTLARFSGDEFVVLCEGLRDPAEVVVLGERVGRCIAEPFGLAGRMLSVTASVGTAWRGPGAFAPGQLVIEADLAMYEAKRSRARPNGRRSDHPQPTGPWWWRRTTAR